MRVTLLAAFLLSACALDPDDLCGGALCDDGARCFAGRCAAIDDGAVFVADGFQRGDGNGWGDAEIGGTWAAGLTPKSSASLRESAGVLDVRDIGAGGEMSLSDVVAGDVQVAVRATFDPPPRTDVFIYAAMRIVDIDRVQAVARFDADGTVHAAVYRPRLAAQPLLVEAKLPAGRVERGDRVWLKADVYGRPATVRVKIWRDGDVEPEGYDLLVDEARDTPRFDENSTFDEATAMPAAGGFAIGGSLSVEAPLGTRFGFDDVLVVARDAVPPA